jgi:hypothetical protein
MYCEDDNDDFIRQSISNSVRFELNEGLLQLFNESDEPLLTLQQADTVELSPKNNND